MAYYDQVTNRQGQAAGSQGVDLRKKYASKSVFAPVDATASYLRSSEYQDWANPEQLALTQGADSIYAGARTAQRAAAMDAQRLGLGRGAAAQFRQDIQRNAMGAMASSTLAASMMGGERRAQGAMLLLDQLRESMAAKALARMTQRSRNSSTLFQGNMASGLGAAFGGLPTDLVGGGFGLGAAAMMSGSQGQNRGRY